MCLVWGSTLSHWIRPPRSFTQWKSFALGSKICIWWTIAIFLLIFPRLTYPSLVNYLIFHPGPFNKFQNYESLDEYDRFVCGWVRDVSVYIYNVGKQPIHVIRASVMHSQQMNATSLHPWIILYKDGIVISAHCDCNRVPMLHQFYFIWKLLWK